MSEPTRDGERHFRGVPRPGRRIAVRYRAMGKSGEGPEQLAATSNIGVGGAFVVTAAPEAVGTMLVVALFLPSGRRLSVAGEVRWVAGSDDPEPGMGVRFFGLRAEEVLVLEEFFSSLTATADFDEPA